MASIDRINKRVKRLQEEKETGTKTSRVQTSMDNIDVLMNELNNGGIKYSTGNKISSPSSSKLSTSDEDDDKKWWQEIFQVPDTFKDNLDAFDDGYDFGDITKTTGKTVADVGKTILGSTADAGLNLVEGVVRVGEGVGTLGAGAVAQVADWVGEDDYAQTVRDRIAGKEETAFGTKGAPVSSWLNSAQKALDNYSIFGETGDEIGSLVGYTGGLAVGGGALGSAGSIPVAIGGTTLNVPTLAVVGGASSGLTEAYGKENVTDLQAWGKALGSGAIEGVTEGLFGMFGVGGNELTDQLGKQATKHFKSGIAKVLAKTGVQATGESVEEFLSYAGNQGLDLLIDKASNEDSAEFYKEWDWEEVGEQMGMAFLSAGIAQGGSNAISVTAQSNVAIAEAENQLGRPLTNSEKTSIKNQVTSALMNENTLNEQKVIDTMVQDRIEEAEASGKPLTDKEIQNITNQIEEDLNSGSLSTEDIEKALGDITTAWNDTQSQINELQGQLEQAETKAEQDAITEQLQSLTDNLSQDSRLQKSYYETAQKRVNFQSEITEDMSEQRQALYRSAGEVMNNTTRTRNFVESVANIAEDTGTTYEFTNNQKLQEQGYSVAGKTIDGLVSQDGKVLINIDSPKALNRVIGHETTHLLEGTKEYQDLQEFTIEYAKMKGEYDSRVQTISDLYKGLNANINNELTSELVGEYLFDTDYINELANKKPTIFRKVYDYVRHLYKKATAGSKEARQLEDLKYKFQKAYLENIKNNKKGSVKETTQEVEIDAPVRESEKTTTQETKDNSIVEAESNTQKEVKSKEKQVVKTEKKETVKETKEVVKKETTKKNATPTQEELDNLENVRLNKSGSEYALEFFRLRDKYGEANLYKGLNHYKSTGKALDTEQSLTDNKGRKLSKEQIEFFKDSKARDKDGNLVTVYHTMTNAGEQFNEFDPRGTEGYRFGDQVVNYFTDSQEMSNSYAGDSRIEKVSSTQESTKEAKYQYEGYVNITNPYVVNAEGQNWNDASREYSNDIKARFESLTAEEKTALTELARKQGKLAIKPVLTQAKAGESFTYYGTQYSSEDVKNLASAYTKLREGSGMTPTYSSIYSVAEQNFKKMWIESASVVNLTTNDIVKRALEENKDGANYDGVIIRETMDYGSEVENPTANDVYVTFNSNQFKAWDNKKPTESEDIRYSLSEDSKGNELKPTVQKWAENSKVRDENGNLKVLYHGTATGEFTVFDKSKANPEGDWGAGFYLTDNEIDVSSNYEDGGPDFDNRVERLAEQIEQEEDISYEEAKIKAREQLYRGSYKITAYANIEKPAIVGKTYLFNPEDYYDNYSPEEFDSEEEYYEAIDQLVVDDVDSAIWAIEREYDFYNGTDDIRNLLWEAYADGGMEIQNLKDKLGELYLETDEGLVGHDVARIIIESLGYDGIIDPTVSTKWNMDMEAGTTHYIVFKPNQIKSITNENPTDNPDINLSLSNRNDIAPVGGNNIYGRDVRIQEAVEEAIAPLEETIVELTNQIQTLQEELAPTPLEIVEQEASDRFNALTDEDAPVRNNLTAEESQELDMLETMPFDLNEEEQMRMAELQDEEALTQDESTLEAIDPFDSRDIKDVGKRSVKAYQYENPEVRPFFQQEAQAMLGDLDNSIKGERIYNPELAYLEGTADQNGAFGWVGLKRETTDDIAYLLDNFNYTYQQIRDGLNAIIEDNGKENNAVSKRIEFMLNDRLMYGYTAIDGTPIPANQEYINFLQEKQILEYSEEAYQRWSELQENDSLVPIDASYTEDSLNNIPIRSERAATNTNTSVRENVAQNSSESIQRDPLMEYVGRLVNDGRVSRSEAPKVTKGKVRNALDTFKSVWINRNVEIDNLSKESGNKNIKFAGDMLSSVAGEVDGNINVAQTDMNGNVIGDSLSSLFQKSKNDGYYEVLDDYLKHYSNIDRHKQGKGSKVSLSDSQKMIAEYDKLYSYLKKDAQKIWKYGDNMLDDMKNAGLIDNGFYTLLRNRYPHYVPYMEDTDLTPYMSETGEVKPKRVIKTAKGGAKNLIGIEEALTKYTYAYKKAIRQNNLYKEIVNTLDTKVSIGADMRTEPTQLNESLYVDEDGTKYLTAYVNGSQESVQITDDLYKGLKNDLEQTVRDLEQKFELITKPLQAVSEVRRNLLTTWSLSFAITNPLKDIQDAVFNSKHTARMLKNYPGSFIELSRAKSKTAKQFLAMYGSGNTMGEFNVDSVNKSQKNIKFLKGVANINNIVELAPRYAEFKASLESGDSIQEAMYNAREITTNFGRGGTIAKALNRNGATFLNASIQGFDKFIRNFSGENGAKGIVSSLAKATIFGVLPAVFNHLAFGGDDEDKDEDYEALPDYIKDNYYLIKTGDGEFIRIPKGRMLSVFGSASRRALEYLEGEEDAFEGYVKNAFSQVGMNNPLEENILTPLIQAINNEAWYGGDIVPSRLQDLPTEEQYDASIDGLSIWLGQTALAKKLGISPYKINYVLDQYSGGIGDLILPTITEEASSDGSFLAPLKDKFTADTVSDNKYVSDIYTLSDELYKKANSKNSTDEDALKSNYIYSITSEMGKLYAERREIQGDTTLSKSEKYEKSQAIKEQINSLAEEGLNTYQSLNKTDNYAIIGDKEYYKHYDEEADEHKWYTPYDDELESLNSLGMDIDEKSNYFKSKESISSIKSDYSEVIDNASEDEKTALYAEQKASIISEVKNANLTDEQKAFLYDKYYANSDTLNIVIKTGIDFNSYLDMEAQSFTADKDAKGNSISGSKKAKVFNYINSMNIDFEQKAILAKLQYNSYDEWNYDIIDYLNNNPDISFDEEVVILKKLGFEVDDEGNISWE